MIVLAFVLAPVVGIVWWLMRRRARSVVEVPLDLRTARRGPRTFRGRQGF